MAHGHVTTAHLRPVKRENAGRDFNQKSAECGKQKAGNWRCCATRNLIRRRTHTRAQSRQKAFCVRRLSAVMELLPFFVCVSLSFIRRYLWLNAPSLATEGAPVCMWKRGFAIRTAAPAN
jgi:hypothetical protein